ncbi:MAG: UDP-N-acetylglucosamine 2-epimerase (non-hydrolyzing) [Patescibacteria group bacterium]
MKRILFIFGTRPEAIKVAPLIKKLKPSHSLRAVICSTGQHQEMLKQVLDFFGIKPDFELNLMRQNQDLFDITSACLLQVKGVIRRTKPDLVLVQGDTATAFAAALAAYYEKVRVGHIEAGLRSHAKYSPFPEEMNRCLISRLADLHFAPTEQSVKNLSREGITKNVWLTGNTVIDALFLGLNIIKGKKEEAIKDSFRMIDFGKRIILVTGHRRESFGQPLREVCMAIKEISRKFSAEIIYPVHPNPNVRAATKEILEGVKRVHLLGPLDYPSFIWLMKQSYLIITDSGGIQEEAPSLGKPVLITRVNTERSEGIKAGSALLVGLHSKKIVDVVSELFREKEGYLAMSRIVNPYGDGNSAQRILDILNHIL